MFCKKCGNEIKEGEKFCTKCGSPTTKEEPNKAVAGYQHNQSMENQEGLKEDVSKKIKTAKRNQNISATVLIVGALLVVLALMGSGGESAGGLPILAVILGAISFYRYKKIEKQLIETGESKQLDRDRVHNKIALVVLAVVVLGAIVLTLLI